MPSFRLNNIFSFFFCYVSLQIHNIYLLSGGHTLLCMSSSSPDPISPSYFTYNLMMVHLFSMPVWYRYPIGGLPCVFFLVLLKSLRFKNLGLLYLKSWNLCFNSAFIVESSSEITESTINPLLKMHILLKLTHCLLTLPCLSLSSSTYIHVLQYQY